jgi:hypothetical protein
VRAGGGIEAGQVGSRCQAQLAVNGARGSRGTEARSLKVIMF